MSPVSGSIATSPPDLDDGLVTASPLAELSVVSTDWRGGELSMTVRVAVRGDELYLRGHFPGLPIFPGVFVIETLCQVLAGCQLPDGGRLLLSEIRSVRFLAPLLAGDTLTLQLTATPRSDDWRVAAEAVRTDGTTAARIRAVFQRGEAIDA